MSWCWRLCGGVETVKALLKECMEGAHELSVPMEVEVSVGGNWRDME